MNKNSPIKVKIPPEVKVEIHSRAQSYGLTMAGYIRFLAIKDIAEEREQSKILIVENVQQLAEEINKIRLRINLSKIRF